MSAGWKWPLAAEGGGGVAVPDPSALADDKWMKTTGGVWVSTDAPEGGGGGLVYPDSAPASPSAFDDEFTGGSLDAKWTVVTDATATGFVKTFAKHGTWFAMPNPGAASDQILELRQPLTGLSAGAAFNVAGRIACGGWNSGTNGRITIRITSDNTWSGGSYIGVGISNQAGVGQVEVISNAGSHVLTPMGYPAAHALYFAMQRDTSNVVRCWVSLDALHWRMVDTATRAWDAAYLWIRPVGHNATGNPTEPMIDWVRVNDARFTMLVP